MDAATDTYPSDFMVEIARIVAPPEALTLRAMLEADGIVCHLGGWWHHSIQICPLGLGGFRLSVAHSQYEAASQLVRGYLAEPVSSAPFFAQRRRIVRLLAILGAVVVIPGMLGMRSGEDPAPWWMVLTVPLTLLGTPVPPQGSGDYYLAAKPTA